MSKSCLSHVCFCLLTAALPLCAAEIYRAPDLQSRSEALLQKQTAFASADLARYGNHYTMLAVRNQTGSAEIHEREADFFVIEKGEATLVTGGKLVSPHVQKPGEIRGSAVQGGERHPVKVGDVIHIPAGEPHQLLIENGKPFSYFVIKVTGQ